MVSCPRVAKTLGSTNGPGGLNRASVESRTSSLQMALLVLVGTDTDDVQRGALCRNPNDVTESATQ